MGLKNDLTKIIHNPLLLRKVPGVLLSRYVHYMVGKQLHTRASLLDTSDLNRKHYGWTTVTDQFHWDIFCIQETNLVNFIRTTASGDYKVVVEIGAASDLFLKHIKAEKKIGINVLDICIEQLNNQGITGIKTDGQRIPLENNEADIVICFQTLEHVRDPISFLTELSRITKNKLLLSIPWVQKTNIRAKRYGTNDTNGQPDSEFHIFEFNEEDFKKVLSHTDLKINKYQKLINYEARYDPVTNWCLQKYLYLAYFPALQAYVLEKNPHEPGG